MTAGGGAPESLAVKSYNIIYIICHIISLTVLPRLYSPSNVFLPADFFGPAWGAACQFIHVINKYITAAAAAAV